MKNNSSKFVKVTAKVMLAILTVCLMLTAFPAVAPENFVTAKAAETYNVTAGTSAADITAQLATYTSGTVVNMTLGGDVDFTADSLDLTATEYTGITIPAGITVNLYMNGKSIKFIKDAEGYWQALGIFGIKNYGNLYIFSGNTTKPNLASGTASITVKNVRTDMDSDDNHECAYVRTDCIYNSGNLVVNKSVVITAYSELSYRTDDNKAGAATTEASAIANASANATVVLNSATLSATAKSTSVNKVAVISSNAIRADSRAYAYGVYSGTVTVNGSTTINASGTANNIESSSASNKCGHVSAVSYGICADGKITVNGGTINYAGNTDCGHNSLENGYERVLTGGILYKSGTIPTITDGTINVMTTNGIGYTSADYYVYNEATVAQTSKLPYSGNDLFSSTTNIYCNSREQDDVPDYPTTAITTGQFYDESGNIYTGSLASATDSSSPHPAALIRGALSGTTRVHLIYRYWTSATKDSLDTSIVGSTGLVGYSLMPLGDSTNIVNAKADFNGVTSSTNLTKSTDADVTYASGGETKNNYYWKQFNITYATTTSWYSDYDVTANSGKIFKSFTDSTNTSIPASSSPVYIFCDYYRVDANSITASTDKVVTVTYTGNPIKASACGLKIKDSATAEDYTAEYNIDFTNSALFPVSYTWSGTNEAGVTESGEETELPKNAGTYYVTLNIEDDSLYDPIHWEVVENHKNRNALKYEFKLIIEQASANRGNLLTEKTITYGTKLGDAIDMSSYTAKGVNGENLTGRFSFSNATDATAYKNAGTSTVSITWSPTYDEDNPSVKNYKATSFEINYTVTPAPLVISPNDAKVIYGNTEFVTPFGITISGLVGNDNTDGVKSAIAAAIDYMISVNGSYVAYSPDDVGAGVYPIRARVNSANVPAVLNNYNYSYADLKEGYDINNLTVSKRGLTVQASAVTREYAPDNYNVTVNYTITDGKYSVDDVRVNTGTGALSINTAGIQTVNGVTKNAAQELLVGGSKDNYTIAELTYDTGKTLTVEITKAVPSVETPSVADVFYRRTATLADIDINTAGASVAGTWQWVNQSVNPTVAVSSYQAKFVPDDSTNYETKYVDVSFNVKPTPVTITYTGTVEYGDPVPNITAYTYSAVQDPSFDINSVTTTGNITPSTTYTQGSTVIAGGYAVTILAPNYKDTAGNYTFTTEPGTITVVPRNIEFTVQDESIVYGDNFAAGASTVTLSYDESRLVGDDTINAITSDGAEPTFSYTTTYRYQDNYAVGKYELKAAKAFNTSANYTVSFVYGTLTVTKAPLTIKANTITLAYNSDVPDLTSAYTFVGAKRNEGESAILTSGEITVDTNYTKGSPVTAEGYPIIINISEATFANYSVTVQNGSITVVKANPVVTTYPTASITYGQSLADAVFTGAVIKDSVDGTFVYGSASTVPAYSSEPYTNYTATFVPTDTANYNTVTGLYIPLTVNKMPISGALAVTGIPMSGETLTVDISGLNPDDEGVYTYTWKKDGAVIGTGTSLVLTDAYQGSALTVEAVAQGYYEGTATYTTTTIAPVLPSVANIINATQYANYFNLTGMTAFGQNNSVVYNADQHPITFTQKSSTQSTTVVGDITVKYNGSKEIPVNAGTYTVTVDVATPDLSRVGEADVTVYSPASNLAIGTLTITKAPYNVTVTIGDKVYDGYNTAFAEKTEVTSGAVTLAGNVKDDVAFDADNAVYTFADANVGTDKQVSIGTTALNGTKKDNYELKVTLANGGKADITPRTLKVSVDPIEREYQENYYDVDLSFVVDVTTIAPADTSSSVYVNEALASGKVDDYHAGTRRVTVSNAVLAGTKASNYVLELTNVDGLTVEIQKATPSYPLPATGIVYYDSGRQLSNISLGDDRWAWDSTYSNVIPTAGTHIYKAVYTPDDTANYAEVVLEVPLEVRKAPVTVKASSFTVIYGAEEPTYDYQLTGLTGADTKNNLGGYVIQNCAYQAGTGVGTYSVVFTGGFTSDNYSFTYVPGTVTVNPRPVYVTATPVTREYVAGNTDITVNFSELSNIYAGDNSSVYLTAASVTGSVASDTAGTKALTFTLPELGGSKANNYTLTLLNPDVKAVIAKAHIPGVVLPTSGTVEFSKRLSETVFTSSYEGTQYGTFSMENPLSTPAAVGTTNNVYKVVFTPKNTVNYATETAYITLTVTQMELNVDLGLVGTCMVGKTLYVVTGQLPSGAEDYIIYRWYRLANPDDDIRTGVLVDSNTTEHTLTDADKGNYIVCVATNTNDSPYAIESRISTDEDIAQETLSFWQKLVKWFYKVISSITQLFGKI